MRSTRSGGKTVIQAPDVGLCSVVRIRVLLSPPMGTDMILPQRIPTTADPVLRRIRRTSSIPRMDPRAFAATPPNRVTGPCISLQPRGHDPQAVRLNVSCFLVPGSGPCSSLTHLHLPQL